MKENPDYIIRQGDHIRKNMLDRSRYLCEKGYAKETFRTCGTPKYKRTFRHITRLGLAVLMEAPDEAAIEVDSEMEETHTHNGKIKVNHFRSSLTEYTELREQLYAYAGSDDPDEQDYFYDILLDTVIEEKTTPMSCAIHLTKDTKLSVEKYSQNQLYNIWRLSHINAMFRSNNHLTYLDRRPL